MRLRANFVKVVYQETTAYWHGKRGVWVTWISLGIRLKSQVHHWSDLRNICCGNRSGQLKSYLTRIGHDLVIQNIGISTKYGYNSKYFWYVLTPEVALCLTSLLNFATTQAPLILLSLIEAS